jgi:UDP-3-O-[3-hydroxymyristoyl] glucosamine N-acyltransferase
MNRVHCEPRVVGVGVYVDHNVVCGRDCCVAHGSYVGYPIDRRAGVELAGPTTIGDEVQIGCHCVLEEGARLGDRVSLDHYVRVGANTSVGPDSYLLYGTRIHRHVTIGSRCRISGNCPDGTVIGDDVTHFGRIHHRYNDPWAGWEENEEAAPRIGRESVIAAGAIIIGDIEIGERCFIAAGEIVRRSVPSWSVFYRGLVIPADSWTGSLRNTFFRPRS